LINNILVTLDGSPLSEAILPYVSALARGLKPKPRVTLLHVMDPNPASLPAEMEDLPYVRELRDSSKAATMDYLRRQATTMEESGIEVATEVQFGRPSQAILAFAERQRPDLIAMATHGRSGLRRAVLGSVATHILSSTAFPLLLVRPRDEATPPAVTLTDVIVPLDTSELSEAVLPIAQHIAKSLGLNVRLVTALPTLAQLYLGTQPVAYPADIIARAEDTLTEYLQEVSARLQQNGLNATWEILRGDAGDAIVDYARALPNNLIAISTHGRSGLGRWVVGSVADKVVRSSGDPVLIIRPSMGV
jgi:nucleotide-binding universal stress UspA family protein